MTLKLPRAMHDAIVAHTREGGTDEVCGLIFGRAETPLRLFRVTNVALEKFRFYEMAPEEVLRLMLAMEKEAMEIVVIYHSHPSSPAYPSKTDVAIAANWPDQYYVICSVWDTQQPPVRAYRIVDENITEHAVVIEQDGEP